MGKPATYITIVLAALASQVLQLALPYAANTLAPRFTDASYNVPVIVLTMTIPGFAYWMILRARDGSKFTLIQSFALYALALVFGLILLAFLPIMLAHTWREG